MKIHRINVHLADDEFGNALMEQIARALIDANPDKNLLVTVYEHAGWFLQYVKHPRDLTRLLIVGTANDMAVLSLEAEQYIHRLRQAEAEQDLDLVILPEIRRSVDGDGSPASTLQDAAT